jgi:sulfide:quinone oxidoreductase
MDMHAITTELSVSPQVRASDLPEIAAAGFRAIICNRPDGEAADQPLFRDLERAARDRGLAVRHLPVESGRVTDQQGHEFATLMRELPKPVLAFCANGMRSTMAWARSQVEEPPPAAA